ncbi:MAG: hypothetical protein AB7G37_03380 [Solirubrobacteraceae bacterium]
MTDTTTEPLQFEGELVRKLGLAISGKVEHLAAPFHRNDEIAFVGFAGIDEIAHKLDQGGLTRLHKAKASQLEIVAVDVVRDVIDDDHERRTGQLRLLTADGEQRAAARRILDRRRDDVDERGVEEVLAELDSHDVPLDFLVGMTVHSAALNDIVQAAELGKLDLEAYLIGVVDIGVEMGTWCMKIIEWARRRDNDRIVAEEEAKAEERRRQAEAREAAGLVHADEVADKADRRGLTVLQGGKVEQGVHVDDTTGEVIPPPSDADAPAAEPEPAKPRRGTRKAKAEPGSHDDELAKSSRPATHPQQVALSGHIFAMQDQPIGAEFVRMFEAEGWPISPGDMTFGQARRALIFFGDTVMAEAE